MATNCKNCGVKLACLGWRTCDLCDKKERNRKLALKIKRLNEQAEKRQKKKKEEVVLTQTKNYNLEPENLVYLLNHLNIQPITEPKIKTRGRESKLYFHIKITKSKILDCECGDRYLEKLWCPTCRQLQKDDLHTRDNNGFTDSDSHNDSNFEASELNKQNCEAGGIQIEA
jgi:hypothetical protein